MSGVLDRMAKRALGALPTVEPRSEPLFAQQTAGSGGAEAPVSGMQEVNAEVESSRGGGERSSRRTRQTLGEENQPPNSRSKCEDEFSAREAARPTAPTPARANASNGELAIAEPPSRTAETYSEDSAPHEDVAEGLVKPKQANAESRTRKINVEAEPETFAVLEQRKASAPIAGERAANPIRGLAEAGQEALLTSTLIERIVEAEESHERGEGQEPLVRSSAKAARQRNQPEQRVTARNESKALALDSPAEQKTEIHISIGSIELRAPRVEARPPAAPFRPRVTLDEFLRRKPEARQ